MLTREQIPFFFGTWTDMVANFVQTQEFTDILAKLKQQKEEGRKAYPADHTQIFRAFKETPIDKVRVIIIGMDPYPSPDYANGLAFSIPRDLKTLPVPASLVKIIDTVEKDCYNGLNFDKENFDVELKHWTDQGIMLLNSAFTVGTVRNEHGLEVAQPGSHMELWRPFAKYLIKEFDQVCRDKIFLAWGQDAQELVAGNHFFRNFTFVCEHPSKASREQRDWKNENCFNRVNTAIQINRLGEPIKW